MNFGKKAYLHTLIIICGILVQVSCAKDADLLSSYVVNDVVEDTGNVKPQNTIVLPSNFDWQNIPPEYANSVLEINEVFDLNDQTVELPMYVTLYFNEGHLENGTVEGDSTVITTEARDPIAEDVTFTGTYGNEYIMPHWFGAVMDGVTDDRDAFVETLAYADSLNLKVLIDRDMFLDVEETGKKSIFLEDNTWIEGADDARIIVNNLLSPAFYIALSENVVIRDISFLYDQTYNAAYVWSETSDNHLNQQQLEDYLSKNKDLIFKSTNPVFKGSSAFHSVFSIEAAKDVIFENVTFKSKGETANTFMQYVFKFKEQYVSNQVVSDEATGLVDISSNITFSNIEFDGYLMGIQGNVKNFTVNNLIARRYSDLQNADGSNLGGLVNGNHYFPPPHLFYLNQDSSIKNHPINITLLNVIDYGNYVGTLDVRTLGSGYCNSLKLVDKVENIIVDGYESYRRDGLGDWGGIINGSFNNLYAESTVGIFDSNSKFNSLRFLGPITNTSITNMTIKDNSEKLQIYPLDYVTGNNVIMDNIHVEVNELDNLYAGPFGISGSNNTVINSSLNILNHISTRTYSPVIFHDDTTLEEGENNYYEIEVKGWRAIDSEPIEKSPRVLLANANNNKTNFAKVHDLDNNYIIEQINELKKDVWIKTETVVLENGNSKKINLSIPSGYILTKIKATIEQNLIEGVEVSIGTSGTQKSNILGKISNNLNLASHNFEEENSIHGPNSIYLYSNKEFGDTGVITIEIELERYTTY
ncbi:hypothetical protein [uncultured Maribacter sp.]|uniref:hypothetical protein n=1 Tax=uncultured Maribacter sp. TaxID=431308 RepID=UPI002614F506|nr:hypothetical protein [uncultured Maribacter sp.]